MDFFKIYVLTGDQRCKNRNLSACVMSLYICLRISLCISLILSLLQNFCIICTLKEHLCHHVVRCSVQDSDYFINTVCCQRRIQCTDNRNASSYTCLKHKVDLPFTGNLKQLRTMLCNQCFIGCCHTLACFQALLYKCIGRFNSSHRLYNDRYFRIIENRIKIMRQNLFHRISRKVSEIQYIFYINLILYSFIDQAAIRTNHFYNT